MMGTAALTILPALAPVVARSYGIPPVWIGYQFSTPQTFGALTFQGGGMFFDGGWFASIRIQVLQGGAWVTVPGVAFTPAYAGNDGVSFRKYEIAFPAITGTAIRVDGTPGGRSRFISVGELRVFRAP